MAKIGRKTEDELFGKFVEFSVRGIPKKQLKIVVQKTEEKDKRGVWYIYKVTPTLVKTVGWSYDKYRAIDKAREYIHAMKV